jgi:hypothetical protein
MARPYRIHFEYTRKAGCTEKRVAGSLDGNRYVPRRVYKLVMLWAQRFIPAHRSGVYEVIWVNQKKAQIRRV